MYVSRSCQSRCYRLPGAELYPTGVALVPGGGKGSLTPALLEGNGRLARGHHHSGSNSAADLATPAKADKCGFSSN